MAIMAMRPPQIAGGRDDVELVTAGGEELLEDGVDLTALADHRQRHAHQLVAHHKLAHPQILHVLTAYRVWRSHGHGHRATAILSPG